MLGASVLQAFRNLRLARKFTLGVVLVMAVVVIALTTLIIGYQRSSLRAEIDRHEQSLARNLARDAVGPLIFLDPLRLDVLRLQGTARRRRGEHLAELAPIGVRHDPAPPVDDARRGAPRGLIDGAHQLGSGERTSRPW